MTEHKVELPVFKTKSGVELVASKTRVFIVESTDDDENPYKVLEAHYLGQLPATLDRQQDLGFDAGDFARGVPNIYWLAKDSDFVYAKRADAEVRVSNLMLEYVPAIARQRVAHAEAMLKAIDGDDLAEYGVRLLTDVARFVKNDPTYSLSGAEGAKRRTIKEMLAKVTDAEKKKDARRRAEEELKKYRAVLARYAPVKEVPAPPKSSEKLKTDEKKGKKSKGGGK